MDQNPNNLIVHYILRGSNQPISDFCIMPSLAKNWVKKKCDYTDFSEVIEHGVVEGDRLVDEMSN